MIGTGTVVTTDGGTGIGLTNVVYNVDGTNVFGIMTTVGWSGTIMTDVTGIVLGNLVIGTITGFVGKSFVGGKIIDETCGMIVGT